MNLILQVRAASSKVSPFLWDGAFTSAKFLLLLPLEHLPSLAEEAGDPTREERTVTIIHMTIRCGSTILGQVSKRSHFTTTIVWFRCWRLSLNLGSFLSQWFLVTLAASTPKDFFPSQRLYSLSTVSSDCSAKRREMLSTLC